MYHILKKKYGTREKGFCAMYKKGMTFLLLSLLILFIPFYLFSFAEAANNSFIVPERNTVPLGVSDVLL